MAGGVIKTMFVSYDSDVRKIAEEDESAKLKLFFRSRCGEASPQCARAAAFKIDSYRLESAPNEPRTIEGRRSGAAPAVASAKSLVYRRRDQLTELETAPAFGRQWLRRLDLFHRSQRNNHRVVIQSGKIMALGSLRYLAVPSFARLCSSR